MGGAEETTPSDVIGITELADENKLENCKIEETIMDLKHSDLTAKKDACLSSSEIIGKEEKTSAWDPESMSLMPEDHVAIEEAQSRISVNFLINKSKNFCGAIRLYLSKSASTNSSKLKSFVTSLNDYVKNTLAKTVPSSRAISHITSSLVNTLKGRRLPSSLRFLGFKLIKRDKKMIKGKDNGLQQKCSNGTFLSPFKKPELEHLIGFPFARPKFYECGHCGSRFFKLPFYIKHIRRHNEIISCESCGKTFASLRNKRKHELQCVRRAIL